MKYLSIIFLSILAVNSNVGSILAYPNGPKTAYKDNANTSLQTLSWTWQFVSAPLGDAKIEGILVDPEDENTWYVSSIDQGLYITRDGGTTWEHPLKGRGLDAEGYQIDPTNPKKLYATLWNKLYVSNDKGLNWTELYTCPEYIRSLHISSVDGSIYLGPQTEQNNNPGIYKSTDGGNSFQLYTFGVSTHNLICWDIDEDPKSGMLFVSVEIADHPQPYNPPFFRSTDGGTTWQNIAGPIKWHALKVQVDTTDQKLYYLVESGGLYKSDNLGNDWQLFNFNAMFLLLDQQHQNQLYAGDNANFGNGGAWFSGNGGAYFSSIGLSELTVVSLALNKLGTKLYAACYDSGVWVAEIPQDAGSGLIVTNTNDSGQNSLRDAIQIANANPGADTIRFAIPISDNGYDATSGTWTLQPQSELPNITDDSLFIDGGSQSLFIGSNANPYGPEIIINGTQSGSNTNGLRIFSSNNRISTLAINGFNSTGVWIDGSQAQENIISGCYIGTDPAGKLAVPNGSGIYVNESAGNLIGGMAAESRNIISGNSASGIIIFGEQAGNNRILGNYIGLTASGSEVLGNQWMGINIGSDENTIGGSRAGEGNIISGNGNDGIRISGNRNTVKGNYIGTDATGSVAIGNNWDGIMLYGAHNIIGGTDPGDRNLISGNKTRGILFNDGDDNRVLGNYIGTDITGQSSLGNADVGIGLYFGAQHNIIGPDNIIAFNYTGVQVFSDSSFGNTITENSIFNNTWVGITLGTDSDKGNNSISRPVITSVNINSVTGTAPINSTVEIFSDEAEEGKLFEGKVTADGNGIFTWSGSATGLYVTATATDADGNTSEFSSAVWLTTIEQDPGKQIPEIFTLDQNYPNPFNPSTTIDFAIPQSSFITLKIYNILGNEIETLLNEQRPAGVYKVNWMPTDLPNGIYLYQLQAGDFNETRRLILLK